MTLAIRSMIAAAAAACVLAAGIMAAGPASAAGELPYGLEAGKPYAGTKLNILSQRTPQLRGLMLRDGEFTGLTGIETEWTFITVTSLQEKVASVGVAADGGFDVVSHLDSWGPSNAHWLVGIDDMMAEDGIGMDRYPAVLAKSARFEGRTIGFPLRAHAQVMFYRKDVLADVGMDPPRTWDDVVAVADAIRAKGLDVEPLALYFHNDGSHQNLFIWLNFLRAAGADVFDAKTCPAWDSEAGLAATEDYIALHTLHKVTNPSSIFFVQPDALRSFLRGDSAMSPLWRWIYLRPFESRQSVLTKEQIGFAGMPSYKGRTITYARSLLFSISKYSKHQGAAWEFMKWLSNPALEKKNATEREVAGKTIINNVVTHTANFRDADVNAANDMIQQAAWESLKESDVMPQIAEWPEIGDVLSAAIARAAAGGDTRALMTEASGQARKILRRAGHCG